MIKSHRGRKQKYGERMSDAVGTPPKSPSPEPHEDSSEEDPDWNKHIEDEKRKHQKYCDEHKRLVNDYRRSKGKPPRYDDVDSFSDDGEEEYQDQGYYESDEEERRSRHSDDESYRSDASAPVDTPLGNKPNKPRDDLPPRSDWGGPEAGDDKDAGFLVDDDKKSIPSRSRSCDDRTRRRELSVKDNRERSRSRDRDDEHSRPKRSRPDKSKGKGKAKGDKKGKSKDDKSKDKSKGKSKDKSKKGKPSTGTPGSSVIGKGQGPSAQSNLVDDPEALSEETKRFLDDTIDCVPTRCTRNKQWRAEFFQRIRITRFGSELKRDKFCNGVIQMTKEMNQAKRGCESQNKRVYIGPGRDGSSEDKISVDCKFYPANTKIHSPQQWKEFEGRRILKNNIGLLAA